jgi:hypothetical protein
VDATQASGCRGGIGRRDRDETTEVVAVDFPVGVGLREVANDVRRLVEVRPVFGSARSGNCALPPISVAFGRKRVPPCGQG